VGYILSISHKLKSVRENSVLTIGNEISVLDGLHNIGNGITHLLFSKRGSYFKACKWTNFCSFKRWCYPM